MPIADHAALHTTAMPYLEGMIWGQADKLSLAFHPNATAAGHFRGAFLSSGRDDFIPEWLGLDPLPPGTPFAHTVTVLDLTGNVACLKVTDTCFGDDYTDYLTLIRDQGQWQITHKAWFVHPKA